jgi:hypothetical protein
VSDELTHQSAPDEVIVEGTYTLDGHDRERINVYVRDVGMEPDDALFQAVQDTLGHTGFKVSVVGP